MKASLLTRGAGIAALVTVALGLTACGSDNPTGAASSQGDTSAAGSAETSGAAASGNAVAGGGAALSGTLAGAGASSQEGAQDAWRAGFQQANPDVTITYDPVGSGGGVTQFLDGAVAFAGTDSALKPEQVTESAQVCQAGQAFDLPVYISPIAVVFNLSGVSSINLAPATIAQIFDGKITSWDDPAIAADNPGVTLPATAITPVSRSDESGTTKNFTDYLAATAPDAWPYEVSGTWPVQGGQSAQGSSGIVQTVQGGDGTIGYVDASKVGSLGVASIKVGDTWQAPSAEGAAKVVAESPRDDSRAAHDIVVKLDRTASDAGAYPLLLVSYLVACDTYQDTATADLVKSYLTYVSSADGQQTASSAAGSAPLSTEMASDVAEAIATIKAS